MTQDEILQIRTYTRKRSLIVIDRDDAVLNDKVRQGRKSKVERRVSPECHGVNCNRCG